MGRGEKGERAEGKGGEVQEWCLQKARLSSWNGALKMELPGFEIGGFGSKGCDF